MAVSNGSWFFELSAWLDGDGPVNTGVVLVVYHKYSQKSERKTTKKCRKGVRFSEEDEVKDEVKDADNHEDAHKQISDGGILANSLTMKTSDLKV